MAGVLNAVSFEKGEKVMQKVIVGKLLGLFLLLGVWAWTPDSLLAGSRPVTLTCVLSTYDGKPLNSDADQLILNERAKTAAFSHHTFHYPVASAVFTDTTVTWNVDYRVDPRVEIYSHVEFNLSRQTGFLTANRRTTTNLTDGTVRYTHDSDYYQCSIAKKLF